MISASALVTVLAATALWPPWPFGRDDDAAAQQALTIQELESEAVEIDVETPISDSQAKAMENYQLFIDLAADDPVLQAEAMRRLADLQLEAGELDQLQRNLRSAEARPGDAVHLYERLLESYPEYEKNDLVLYQLARAYELGGQLEQALNALDRLVTEYPDTRHFAEAHFRRGETLFVQRRYDEAGQAYGAALATADTRFREQSLYKHGWALFKQFRHEESLESFFELLDRKFVAEGNDVDPAKLYTAMGRAEQELVDDAFRVLSISFSYIDGPESVTEYFKTVGLSPYAYIVYSHLGDLYLEKERYQDAAAAYQAFGELDTYHSKAPLLQAQVVEAYKQGGFAGLVLEAKQSFVERYGAGSVYWERYSYLEQAEVASYLKSNLTDLAAYHHAEAQAAGDSGSYRLAARWYGSYLAAFPDDPDSAEINFLLAEVLYESGDFHAATLEYERTAYVYPSHGSNAEAGYAALLAYAEHEASLQGPERELWHRQGIDSALKFAELYPGHAQAAAALTDAAEKLFALNELDRAKQAGQVLLARRPAADGSLQRTAWAVVAHSEFDEGSFAAAEAAYLRLAMFIAPDDEEYHEITERIASSIYKQGEQARNDGSYRESVNHFLRVVEAAPSSEIVATARYDAAAGLVVLEDWSRASVVLEEFRRDYPEHEYSADITAKLAVAYLNSGNDLRAANEFERIADGDEADEIRKEALWRAAELYRTSGQLDDASVTLARYVDRYPRPAPFAIEALQQLVGLAEQTGDYPARMRWLEAVVAADAEAGEERNGRTRDLAAHAALGLARPARDAFVAIQLAIPLRESLELKKQRMENALGAYGRALDYAVADVTTAATYEIAELYHALSRALLASERPSDLSALELGQYEILLEEQAYPFEEQAIDLHEVNAARTAEGLYDDSVKLSLEALAVLVPGRYAKYELGEQIVAAIH